MNHKNPEATYTKPKFLHRLLTSNWLPETIASLAGVIFLLQVWGYAHTQQSPLDEGAYLMKGYLYLSGKYDIYQDYGPWSNHMPLSFYIPGSIQFLFGPGVGAGRYFSLILAGLMLAGIWIVANRFGGKWWAAGAVLVFAVNPAVIKMYSVAVPQVIIACMLAWVLVLVLGDGRPTWQITLGSVLAGLMLLTRINMLPVLPLLLLYIFWQHGARNGIIATIASLLIVFIGHYLFWPGILKIWAKRFPRSLTPFLDPWRYHIEITDIWNPQGGFLNRLLSFLYSLRIHFVALMGVFTAVLLWQRSSKWGNSNRFKAALFLLSLFSVLLLIHLWAALGEVYCIYCLDGYIAYFSLVGILLIVVSFSSWRTRLPLWFQIFAIIFILVIAAGLGYGSFGDIGDDLLAIHLPRALIDFPDLSPGSVPLDAILINKFNLEYAFLRRLIPVLSGVAAGLLAILLALLVWFLLRRREAQTQNYSKKSTPSYGYIALLCFLCIGVMLTPTGLLGGGGSNYDCTGDVIRSYRETGEYLANSIPLGSKVYWMGGLSAVPLLYIPEIEIYPSQLNDGYSFKTSGNSQELSRWGFWNKELALHWLKEADFVLIEQRSFHGWHMDAVLNGDYQELESTPLQVPCRQDSWIRVFKGKQ